MIVWLLTVALAAAPFGSARVDGEQGPDGLLHIELEVVVEGPAPGAVVAHLGDPGGGSRPVSLAARGEGRFGGFATVEPVDLVIVFEAVDGDESVMSDPLTLTELGLDPELLPGVEPGTTGTLPPAVTRWGWAALALGAIALLLLFVWWWQGSSPAEGPAAEGAANSERDA